MRKINIFNVIINQILIMFLLMVAGYYIYKKGLINDIGTKQISNLLMRLVGPIIIITSFQKEFSTAMLKELLLTFIISLATMVVGFILVKLIFKKEDSIEKFAATFSNAGFIGIPLVQSLLGMEYVFYLSAYLVCFNLLSWTYGIYLLTGKKEAISLKNAILNPGTIGASIGFLLYVFSIKLPEVILTTFNSIGSINTPLAMMILGAYIAKSDFVLLFKDYKSYFVSFISLVIIPIIITFMLLLVPDKYIEIRTVILIATAAPVGMSVAMFCEQYGSDYEYGARIVSISTILSLITLPLIITLSNIVW